MYQSKTISLLIPCYNEEKGLNKLLQNKPPFIDEIIVIDNASTDATAEIAARYGALVVFEPKRGYGQAYLAGLPKVTGDIIVTLDGDGTYPMSEIEKLLSLIENEHCDFVTGRRYPLTDKNIQPFINRCANWFISMLIRILFHIKLMDSQSGMMAFKRHILNKIKIQDTGMGFSQEIKIKAFTNKDIQCREVWISYRLRTGEVKFKSLKDGMHNLYSAIHLWQKLRHPSSQ